MAALTEATRIQRDEALGLVTFLFTDIEGSTRLWDEQPRAMRRALARHDAVLREVIQNQGGHVFKTIGDAFCATFDSATAAVAAAATAQSALQCGDWGVQSTRTVAGEDDAGHEDLVQPRLRVRMALHAGEAQLRDGDYFGPPLNRVARLLAAAHGGQVLLSSAIEDVLANQLPAGLALLDLGEHRLRDLARPARVYQLVGPGLVLDFPPLRTLASRPNNLPVQVTSFIGREPEVAEVKRLLGATRLLTLTGMGGTGKTRLALQVAADLVDAYPDGVWFVELAELTDPDLVAPTVASTLGLREEPGRAIEATLAEFASHKDLLVVLDNCEHVLERSAALADKLLRASERLTMLATSREALGISGETSYAVPSLSLPTPGAAQPIEILTQYEAVRLFIERAQAVKPGFQVTNANAPAVAQICHRLDGIPLALELAAARLRLLSPDQIAERLDQRFGLLTGGSRTAMARQQTLQAAIDWSYDLLADEERRLFCRLSVFRGGWALEAAEAVCSGTGSDGGSERGASATGAEQAPTAPEVLDVLDLLGRLVDKSLVAQEIDAQDAVRYRYLESIRQYARDKLAPSGDLRTMQTTHLGYFRAWAEDCERGLKGPEQVRVLAWLDAEHDNLRGALEWALAGGDVTAGLSLGAALWRYWYLRGHLAEGRAHLAAALAQPDGAPTRARAGALHGAGTLARMQGDYPAARELLRESLSVWRELGDQRGMAGTLGNLGIVAQDQGDYKAAQDLLEESLAINRRLGEHQGAAASLTNLAGVAIHLGDYPAARKYSEESLALSRELGNRHVIAEALISLGVVARMQSDYASARRHFDECLAIQRELGNKHGINRVLANMGAMAAAEGHYLVARQRFEEALEIARESGDRSGIARYLGNLGVVVRESGDAAAALPLLEQCLAIRMELDDKHGIAWALNNLGVTAYEQGDHSHAWILLRDGLARLRDLDAKADMAEALEVFGWLIAGEGDARRAACLLGAADGRRKELGACLEPAQAPRHETAVALVRAAMAPDDFDAAWVAGRSMPWDAAVAFALASSGAGAMPDLPG